MSKAFLDFKQLAFGSTESLQQTIETIRRIPSPDDPQKPKTIEIEEKQNKNDDDDDDIVELSQLQLEPSKQKGPRPSNPKCNIWNYQYSVDSPYGVVASPTGNCEVFLGKKTVSNSEELTVAASDKLPFYRFKHQANYDNPIIKIKTGKDVQAFCVRVRTPSTLWMDITKHMEIVSCTYYNARENAVQNVTPACAASKSTGDKALLIPCNAEFVFRIPQSSVKNLPVPVLDIRTNREHHLVFTSNHGSNADRWLKYMRSYNIKSTDSFEQVVEKILTYPKLSDNKTLRGIAYDLMKQEDVNLKKILTILLYSVADKHANTIAKPRIVGSGGPSQNNTG